MAAVSKADQRREQQEVRPEECAGQEVAAASAPAQAPSLLRPEMDLEEEAAAVHQQHVGCSCDEQLHGKRVRCWTGAQ